ncbi:MAG: polysaccharide pyruvyl transferase family protein [Neptunomonas phycophila]
MQDVKNKIRDVLSHSFLKSVVSFFIFRGLGKLEKKYAVLIAAPGGGNIGDQAMLESFICNVPGKKIIINTNDNAINLPEKYQENVKVINLTGLVYGWLLPYIRDAYAFKKILSEAHSLSVVGADIMDGGYNPHPSAMRSLLASYAQNLGVSSRILGFSWNASPSKVSLNAIKKAGNAGVMLCARDPYSTARLEKSGVKSVVQVSDTVFANQNIDREGLDELLQFVADKKIAVVNASGLVNKDLDQLQEYDVILKKLRSLGYSIILLPHVIRLGANDLDVCKAIYERNKDVFFVDRLLGPDQIKCIVNQAKIVVTGRMHLSIMSLNALVPAVVLSTQGKVDGLMQYFDTPECSVEPITGFGEKIASITDSIDRDYDDYKSRLSINIGQVRALSAKNFEGLGQG